MPGIFISYRRQDTSGYAGRLYEHLSRHFGKQRVFMDIDTLQPGLDFGQALDQAVERCDVLLALIGPNWLNAVDADGSRRLENADDFVRMEIAAALARDEVRVVPVLFGNASMPRAAMLPDDLKPLARRHAVEISDNRWDYDVRRLISQLEQVVQPAGLKAGLFTAGKNLTTLVSAAVTIAIVAALVLGFNLMAREDEDPPARPRATEVVQFVATDGTPDVARADTAGSSMSGSPTRSSTGGTSAALMTSTASPVLPDAPPQQPRATSAATNVVPSVPAGTPTPVPTNNTSAPDARAAQSTLEDPAATPIPALTSTPATEPTTVPDPVLAEAQATDSTEGPSNTATFGSTPAPTSPPMATPESTSPPSASPSSTPAADLEPAATPTFKVLDASATQVAAIQPGPSESTPDPIGTPTLVPTSTLVPVPTSTPTSLPEATTTPAPEPTSTLTPELTNTPAPERTPTPSSTPAAEATPTPEPTGTPGQTPSVMPTRTPHVDSILRDAGLVSESRYVSPNHGYTVQWDESWELDDFFEQPVVSTQDGGADELNLTSVNTYLTYLKVYGYSTKGYPAAELERQLAHLRSEDFLNGVFVDNYTVILEASDDTSGGLVVLWETEGWEYLWVFETYLAQDGELLIRVAFTTTPGLYQSAWERTSETVRVNGEDPFAGVFDVNDVLAAVGRHQQTTTSANSPTPIPTSSPSPTPADTPATEPAPPDQGFTPTQEPGGGYA